MSTKTRTIDEALECRKIAGKQIKDEMEQARLHLQDYDILQEAHS